ncbi:MAG: RNA polymerase sigma-70 factor, partial [Bacteroidota bacterium]
MENYKLKTDKDLIVRIKENSTEAFDILFMRYFQKLYHFAYKFLKSHEEAEEIVQEVFIQLWEKRLQLNPEYSFNSYIFTVAKNKVLNVIRKKVSEKKYLESITTKGVLHDFSTENDIHFKELNEISKEAINALSPKRKMIFQLSREKDMTYEEIAQQLGISKKTVENQ